MLILLIDVHNIVICVDKTLSGRLAHSLACFGFPVGHREQRETRSVGGGGGLCPDGPRCTHTNTHSLSHSHVICYPICTVTKLPVTPGPSGGWTRSYTVKQSHRHTHTKV